MTARLVLPARFNGPARSANGGFACGSLAGHVPHPEDSAVEVTLRRPPPLDTALTVDGTRLVLDGEVLAEARVVDEVLKPVDGVSRDVAAQAMARYPGATNHPFTTCFACGPDRSTDDGLRIFPGPVDDLGLVASVWVPQPSHASDVAVSGPARCGAPVTWAALDCVGGWSEDLAGRPCVLGRMTARLDARPVVGQAHVVVGRHLGRDGRKTFTASTVYDGDGRVVASARHTWLRVDPAMFDWQPPVTPTPGI